MTGPQHPAAGPLPPVPPGNVTDPMLWRAAHGVLERHWPRRGPVTPRHGATQVCAECARVWPCQPYQLAREAERLATIPRTTPLPGQPIGPDEVDAADTTPPDPAW